ncbi:hypothetical protein LX32DRAFT_725107 [Colletotrichum zoysiae]|uniref:Uncharacterized protein n=1 Tax=Colletotrichum zoysiae TaxID=1216348 RepID=A0AAD9HSM4_9PEZI|nr:hypothetical protein LX32DRAFT_725107 [Colletotrichum zoysiae]
MMLATVALVLATLVSAAAAAAAAADVAVFLPARSRQATAATQLYGTLMAATQSSAGQKSAQPPAIKPTGGYAGVVVMTVLTCVVAFGIGSILGWIWPDGLRSE